MSPRTILAELDRRGVTVQAVAADRLYLSPRKRIPTELVDEIRRAKPAILRLLGRNRDERYRALALSALVDRLSGAWRWIHDERPALFHAICRADEARDLVALEHAIKEAVEAAETTLKIPDLPECPEDAIGAAYFVGQDDTFSRQRTFQAKRFK